LFTCVEEEQIVRLAAELSRDDGVTLEADAVSDHHILGAAEVLLLEGQLALRNGTILKMDTSNPLRKAHSGLANINNLRSAEIMVEAR
jgi:hypothetical protein